jgi:anti-sigma factor RsiW
MSQPSEIHTLVGAYALDALTEIERAGFARHIAACEACAAEVAELGETASRLGAVAWEPAPPRLRNAVLAEVSRTRQVTAGRAESAAHGGEVAVRRWRRWTAAAVAAGVVAIGGVATTVVIEEGRIDDAREQTERLTAVLAAGDARLRTTQVPGGGTVSVAVSPSLNRAVVVMSGLSEPPVGKTYQLWLLQGTSPSSVGVMAAGQRAGTLVLDSIGAADTLGVTIEPVGGSRTPTLPAIAGVPLA